MFVVSKNCRATARDVAHPRSSIISSPLGG
jgi:hypothetical protein